MLHLVGMSIELQFKKGSLVLRVMLNDEALPELQRIIGAHQSDESPSTTAISVPALSVVPSDAPADPNTQAKAWLSKRSAGEVLNQIRWNPNPEKILLLAAFHEASGGASGWRKEDMEARYLEARESFPGNFGRDIGVAIKNGIITSVTPRTYTVSRTGWNKISEAISALPIS